MSLFPVEKTGGADVFIERVALLKRGWFPE
jgi:hypothetical protein